MIATDFVSFDFTTGAFGTANPNFGGDSILFGIGQVAQFGSTNTAFTAIHDNLNLTVNAAPEPADVLQVLVGLVGLAWAQRRGWHPLPQRAGDVA